MEFKTFDELLSMDDLKRLGLPEVNGLTFSERPLVNVYSKKYQQKIILEEIKKEFSRKLASLSPTFEPLEKLRFRLTPNLYLAQKEDGSFEFHFDMKQTFSFLYLYYQKKYVAYHMEPSEIVPGIEKGAFDDLPDDVLCEKFEEAFLKIFRKVNIAVQENRERREEIIADRKLAKYLSKNMKDVFQTMNEPVTLPILEELDKDRFLLLIAIRGMVTLMDMEKGELKGSEELANASIRYIEQYLTLTEYLSKKSGQEYDCSFHGDGELFSFQELKAMYQDYCREHPERVSQIHNEMNYGDIFRYYLMDARTKIKKDEFVKAVKLRFELFPKGEAQEKSSGAFSRKSVVSEDIKKLLEEKHEALLEEKINFFSATDYLWTLEEAQTFNGYRGHIYPNGKVVFEKFYRTSRMGLSPAYDESIISMDLLDFVEVAPKTKTELIELIRDQKEMEQTKSTQMDEFGVSVSNPKYKNVRRIYHVPGWQNKVNQIIHEEAPEYDFDLIETLLSDISNTKQTAKQYHK